VLDCQGTSHCTAQEETNSPGFDVVRRLDGKGRPDNVPADKPPWANPYPPVTLSGCLSVNTRVITHPSRKWFADSPSPPLVLR